MSICIILDYFLCHIHLHIYNMSRSLISAPLPSIPKDMSNADFGGSDNLAETHAACVRFLQRPETEKLPVVFVWLVVYVGTNTFLSKVHNCVTSCVWNGVYISLNTNPAYLRYADPTRYLHVQGASPPQYLSKRGQQTLTAAYRARDEFLNAHTCVSPSIQA